MYICNLNCDISCSNIRLIMLTSTQGSPRRAELTSLAGRSTAPCLIDPAREGGAPLFESADIVDYLLRTYA